MNQQTTLALVPDAVGFNYASLDREAEVAARADAALIKSLMRRTAQDIVDIGNALIRQRDALPGQFLAWIDAEFSMSQRTAYIFIGIADKLGDKVATVASLSLRALDELASSNNAEVTAEVERRIAAGEIPTAADIRRMKQEAEAAKAEADKLTKEVVRVEAKAAQLANEVEEIEAENAELVAKAFRKAEAKADRQYRSVIDDLKARLAAFEADAKKQTSAENVAADAPAATASNVVTLIPRETGDDDAEAIAAQEPIDGIAIVGEEKINLTDPLSCARGMYHALGVIDLLEISPEFFWHRYGDNRSDVDKWLDSSLRKLTALKEGKPQ